MKNLLLSLLISVAWVSCASLSKARLNNLPLIHPGQSSDQLISIMGAPNERVTKGGLEMWYYNLISDDSANVYPYTAKFEKGTLRSFDADYSRSIADRELCKHRKKSDQIVPPLEGLGGGNGAPSVKVDCSE